MENHIQYIRYLMDKGGPEENDYAALDAWVNDVSQQVSDGKLVENQISKIHDEFGEAFSKETMQGFAYTKPHGYAGDFEIIDRIYQKYISDQPHLSNWDKYWQNNAAADAVRNRAEHFSKVILDQLLEITPNKKLNILNVASGPGRDMLYFFENNPTANVHIDCIEQDKNAIDYASAVCHKHIDKITFINKNAMRFKADKKYDLIWSAGLFDYFENKVFIYMLKKFNQFIHRAGKIIVGNFSINNPSKPFMEIFEWHLHHRSPEQLRQLAISAGITEEHISIDKEKSGVNLFLNINSLKLQ